MRFTSFKSLYLVLILAAVSMPTFAQSKNPVPDHCILDFLSPASGRRKNVKENVRQTFRELVGEHTITGSFWASEWKSADGKTHIMVTSKAAEKHRLGETWIKIFALYENKLRKPGLRGWFIPKTDWNESFLVKPQIEQKVKERQREMKNGGLVNRVALCQEPGKAPYLFTLDDNNHEYFLDKQNDGSIRIVLKDQYINFLDTLKMVEKTK